MATDTAPQTPPRYRPRPPGTPWQVPAFLLGAAAVTALVLGRHAWRGDDRAAAARHVESARDALAKADTATALQAGDRALAVLGRLASPDPRLLAEAHFLTGTARLRQADQAPTGDAAKTERKRARADLERVARDALPEADRPKLDFRLAKAAALLNDDPAKVLARLRPAVEAGGGDDAAEGFGLLAQTCLRLSPPDLPAALDATRNQLQHLPLADARSAFPVRFRLADLLLKLGKGPEARPVLEQIGTDAPPELFYAARALLAQSYEETQEWAKAGRNWDKAGTDPQLKPAEKAAIDYRRGRCYALDGRARDAAAAWEEGVKLGGPAARAAGLRLAEQRAEAGPPAAALDALAAALAGLTGQDEWPAALVSLAEARQAVERVFQQFRNRGESDAALKLANLFAPLAPPGDDAAMAGLVADDRAQALAAQAKQAPPEQAPGLSEQARAQYAAAARAYEAAAGRAPTGALRANWLVNCADRYAKAGLADQGAAALGQAGGTIPEDQLAAAWYVLGEALHQKRDLAKAREAYLKCLATAGPYQGKARLQLALLDAAENKLDAAEQALLENQKALRAAPQPDVATLEQTEFALADAAYQRESRKPEGEPHDYAAAEQRFLAALQQYPDSPAAAKARYCLGKTYWYAATQHSRALDPRTNPDPALGPEERKHLQKQMAEALKRALEQFEAVQATLAARQQAGPLPPEEAARLRLAEFSAAECCYFLGRYDETLKRYTALADRYRQQVEELAALSQVWQCCNNALNQPDQARATLQRMRATLEQMPEAAFNGSTLYHQKSFWTDWLDKAGKLTPGMAPAGAGQ
jgi:tetratricopeptide (TPR) repeat protein